MRHVLRRHEVQPDQWRCLGEPLAEGEPVIVPLAELRQESERWWSWSGRLGVRLSPHERLEELAAHLPRLDLVAVEFPSLGEGRGYSQARLLRERYAFRGELRACGPGVTQDQAFLLARCGFDAIELAAPQEAPALRRALERYDVAYQPGAASFPLPRQRFLAPG